MYISIKATTCLQKSFDEGFYIRFYRYYDAVCWDLMLDLPESIHIFVWEDVEATVRASEGSDEGTFDHWSFIINVGLAYIEIITVIKFM